MAHKGKKITTWKFDDRDGVKMDVPVYMRNEFSYAAPNKEAARFYVSLTELEINESDADINELKTRVFALIKVRAVLRWEPFLSVHVTGEGNLAGDEFVLSTVGNPKLRAGLSIYVNRVLVATKSDGQKFHRDYQYSNARVADGEPDTGGDAESMTALIPDTPNNRRALAEIAAAFARLQERLCGLIHPDVVQSTLDQVVKNNGMQMLAGPSDIPKK